MRKTRLMRYAVVVALLTVATAAWSLPQYARTTKMSCATCHTNVAGGADLTDAGKAFKADHSKVPAASVEGADYVGTNKCKTCHLTEYKSWQTLDHAKAMETLKSGDAAKIADHFGDVGKDGCGGCHTTFRQKLN